MENTFILKLHSCPTQLVMLITGTNKTNWNGRPWSLKNKGISIVILTKIFPSVLETRYLKTVFNNLFFDFSEEWCNPLLLVLYTFHQVH